MLSRSTKNVYPVNRDITEFDLNTDVEEYNYDGRVVSRGNLDPEYSTDSLRVFWLYDNDQRVGLVEETNESHSCYWFKDNAFSSLLQEDWTAQDRTIWNIMSEEAYEDCMRKGLDTPQKLKPYTSLEIILPEDIVHYKYNEKACIQCQSTNVYRGCITEKKSIHFDIFYTLFVDSDGVIYAPPNDTRVYATLRRRAGLTSSPDGGGTLGTDDADADATGTSSCS